MRRLAVVVALGLVAACGGGSDQSAPSATAVTDTGTPTTTVVASTSVELTTTAAPTTTAATSTTAAPTTTSATTTTGVATTTVAPTTTATTVPSRPVVPGCTDIVRRTPAFEKGIADHELWIGRIVADQITDQQMLGSGWSAGDGFMIDGVAHIWAMNAADNVLHHATFANDEFTDLGPISVDGEVFQGFIDPDVFRLPDGGIGLAAVNGMRVEGTHRQPGPVCLMRSDDGQNFETVQVLLDESGVQDPAVIVGDEWVLAVEVFNQETIQLLVGTPDGGFETTASVPGRDPDLVMEPDGSIRLTVCGDGMLKTYISSEGRSWESSDPIRSLTCGPAWISGSDWMLHLPKPGQGGAIPTPGGGSGGTANPPPTNSAPAVPSSATFDTLGPAAFTPSLGETFELAATEEIIYGTGARADGGSVELLLNLCVPNTGDDGPRPLLVHIHGGGFMAGQRASCSGQQEWRGVREAAARGWVVASIDYRLARDDPLPSARVGELFSAVGGLGAPAQSRAFVAAADDTLTALDYLIDRSDELNLDTSRIVLKGESAGAIIALTIAFCADKFEIDRPPVAAVVDYSGLLTSSCDKGAVVGTGEPMLFVAHGTEDGGDTAFTNALSIVDAAIAAGINYEFHPLEGVSHIWDEWEETTADGRLIGQAVFDFLDRVLFH